jgi:hypothetical protein
MAHAACHVVLVPHAAALWVRLAQIMVRVVQWFTSPGHPAMEVFEATLHLVVTLKIPDDPRQLLGLRSPISIRHL